MVVALTVLLVAMSLLAGLIVSNLRGVLLGKQRTAATAAAQEWVEVARSLSFATLGLDPGDIPAGDSALVQYPAGAGNPYYYGEGCPPPPPAGQLCEKVAVAVGSIPGGHPFSTHIQSSFVRGKTTMSRRVYITEVSTDVKRVTVIVDWSGSPIVTVDSSVRLSTLVSSRASSIGTQGTPVSSVSNVAAGNVEMSLVQLTGDAEIMRHGFPEGKIDVAKAGPAKRTVCSSRSTFVTGTAGSNYGPAQLTALADDDKLVDPPGASDGPNTATALGGGPAPPADVDSWLVQGEIPGEMSCFGTVRYEPDPPEDSLMYGDAVSGGPSAAGGSPASTTYRVDTSVLVSELGQIDVLDVADTNVDDTHSTVDEGPSGTLLASATQRQSEMHMMKLTPSGGLPIASKGLFGVDAYQVTATARNTLVDCVADPANAQCPSVTNPTMRLWIYDPLLDPTLAPSCTRRSVPPLEPLGYCVLEYSLASTFSLSYDLTLPLVGRSLVYSINVVASPSTTSTTASSGSTTWRAQATPLSGSVRMCVTTSADCDEPTGRQIDMSNSFNLGTVLAQTSVGVAP